MTLDDAMRAVRDFHRLQQVSPTARVADDPIPPVTRRLLKNMAEVLRHYASTLENQAHIENNAGLRVHLTLEETAEWLLALLDGDEVTMLDALADRLYVLFGDAVTYDLPLPAALEEVHRSNMTKEKQPDDPSASRVRSKGPSYESPDLVTVMESYRAGA